jgi:hypothetical protein
MSEKPRVYQATAPTELHSALVDELPVASLTDRYGIGRTALYDRLKALHIEPEKRGKRAYVNSIQLAQLDELHEHLKVGGSLPDDFEKLEQAGQLAPLSQSDLAAAMMAFTKAIQPQPQPSDPLAHIRLLDEACEKGWRLSSSELRQLLKRSRIVGNEIRKYGFICTRNGKNGAESAWLVTRE